MRTRLPLVLLAIILGVGLTFAACGSPTAPARQASFSVAFTAVSGEWTTQASGNVLHGVVQSVVPSTQQSGGGFKYSVMLTITETAGVGATVNAVDLTWFGSSGPFGTTHFDNPLLDAYNNHVVARGTATTKTLLISDSDPTHPSATRIEAKVSFVDDTQKAGFATGASNVGNVSIPAPVIATFAADKDRLNLGDSSTLSWTITNASSATIDNGIGSVATTSGTVVVKPSTFPTVYRLTATNPGGSATQAVTITMSPPTITKFVYGNAVRGWLLDWGTEHAESATIDNGIGPVATNGSLVVAPDVVPFTYRLTATNPGGSTSTTVTIDAPDVEFRLFDTRGVTWFWEVTTDGFTWNHNHYLTSFYYSYPKGTTSPGTPLSLSAYCEGDASGVHTQIWRRGVLLVDGGSTCSAKGVF